MDDVWNTCGVCVHNCMYVLFFSLRCMLCVGVQACVVLLVLVMSFVFVAPGRGHFLRRGQVAPRIGASELLQVRGGDANIQ